MRKSLDVGTFEQVRRCCEIACLYPYRYGFNGKEKDGETYGDGNEYDYGMRIYDPRLGRFMSVDPLKDEYPELTTYQFAGNTPIVAIDRDGEEPDIPAPAPTKPVLSPPNSITLPGWLGLIQKMIALSEDMDKQVYETQLVQGKPLDDSYVLYVKEHRPLTYEAYLLNLFHPDKYPTVRIAMDAIQAARARRDEMIKKGPKDLVEEAKEQKAKEVKAAERKEKRDAQTQRGNSREGNSNQSTKGSHHSGKKGGDKHSNGDARRAKDQGVKGPDATK